MKKLPISAYVVASNEEIRIPRCLESIKDFADEIIVVLDEKSNDNTAKIAESYGAKVVVNKWRGHAVQKSFAEKQCKNDWILALDADEELSEELKQKLQVLFGGETLPEEGGFLMTWIMVYPGQIKPSRFAKKDYIIRLYNQKKANIKSVEFSNHDRPQVHTGKVSKLKEPVYHRSILSFSHLEEKYTPMTQEQAQHNVNKGKKISGLKFYTDFQFKFWKYFILQRMFLLGWYGYTLSIIAAHRNFMRLAKTRELYEIQKLEKNNK